MDTFFFLFLVGTIRFFFFLLTSYVKIMHICKSVLKYYNFVFYSIRSSSSPSRTSYSSSSVFSFFIIFPLLFAVAFAYIIVQLSVTMIMRKGGRGIGGREDEKAFALPSEPNQGAKSV